MRKQFEKLLKIALAFIAVLTVINAGVFASKAYAEEAKAPAKVTVLYFADDDNFPSATGKTDVVTTYEGTVAGKEHWDYGVVTIEPDDGYSVKEIYATSLYGSGEKLTDITYELKNKNTVNASRPQEVKPFVINAIEALDDDDVVLGYIYRSDYLNSYRDRKVNIVLKDTNGNESVMTIAFERDDLDLNSLGTDDGKQVKLSVGDTYDIRSYEGLKEYFSEAELANLKYYDESNSKNGIKVYNIGYTATNAMKFENGAYKAYMPGDIMFTVTHPIDGRTFSVYVKILGEAPLDDIKLSDNAFFSIEDKSVGGYMVSPKDTKATALKTVSLYVKRKANAAIVWDSENTVFCGAKMQENGSATAIREQDVEMKVTHSYDASTGYDEFTITSDYAIEGQMQIGFKDTSTGYSLGYASILFMRNTYMSMNGNQTYYVYPYKTGNLFDYVNVSPDYKDILIKDIISGKVEVHMPGAELVFGSDGENTTFDGSIIFYHPGSYISLYDKELKLTIQSGDLNVVCKTFATIGYGESIDLASIMNGYWEDSYFVKFDTEHGFTYDAQTHTVTAPASGEGEKWCTAYINDGTGIFMVYAYDKSAGDTEVAEIITDKLGAGEALIMDASADSEKVVSDAVIKAVSGSDKTVRITDSKGNQGAKVDWEFKGKDVDTSNWTSKEIKLQVKVATDKEDAKKAVTDCDGGDASEVDGLTIDFENNGKLPGKAKVRVNLLESQYKMFKSDKNLKLYYIDSDNSKITLEQSSITLHYDSNQKCYYAEFEVTHNSKFVLSSADLTPGVLTANKISVKSTKVSLATAAKSQTYSIGAKATGGKITYKSSNSKVKVSSKGKVTIPKGFVGSVTITVKAGDENYKEVTKKVTITVNPVKTSVKSASSPKSGQLKVTWKKNSNVTGYQIQYSTSKSFKESSTKTVTVKKAGDVSKTISNLKKGKTYYVRVRTYKTVSKKNYYSEWSDRKRVKVVK